ncbi:MAG: ABC transporter ATP-binding protein [Pseudomonadota bacterium]
MADAAVRQGGIDVVSERAGAKLPLWRTLFQDSRFVWVATIYGVGVSLLTLALPISVQVLIGAVANTAVIRSLLILSAVLLILLLISGLMVAMQTYVLEVFQRRFYGRMTREIALRTIYADTSEFERMNREQLINYYFEIDIIQKSLPSLLSQGVALLLQTLVGYIVVSFYHPVFLFFSVAHAMMVYLIWRSADRGAVKSVIGLSKAKHEMANWLESIARNHRLFKSQQGIGYAVDRTDRYAADYIEKHKKHFSYTFSQHLGFLGLYALGSAIVLGVAGWLVIRGQLSLGQLVAAELILGAIFIGLSRFSYYLELYYGICASVDKLSRYFDLTLETPRGDRRIDDWEPHVVFDHTSTAFRGRNYRIDAEFPPGSRTLIAPESSGLIMVFRDLIAGLRQTTSGRVMLGGHDVQDFDAHQFRNHVAVVSDSQIFDCTIAEYLQIGDPSMTRAQMRELTKVVGLKPVIDELPDGLDTLLNDAGLPLSTSEIIRLKIALALAFRPRVLVFTQSCDVLRPGRRRAILEYVGNMPNTTFINLSNRRDVEEFDRYMLLGNGTTQVVDTLDEMVAHERRQTLAQRSLEVAES